MIPTIQFTQEVRTLIDQRAQFGIAVEGDGSLTIDRAARQNLSEVASTLSQFAYRFKNERHTFRAFPMDDREQMRRVTDLARYALKKSGAANPGLEREILAAKLGGRFDPDALLAPDYQKFIEVNHLQQRIEALGHQYPAPGILIEGYSYLFWNDLARVPTRDGFSFYYGGRLVLHTDKNLKISEKYSYLKDGLSPFDPLANELRPYDSDTGHIGRYSAEVWTALRNVDYPQFSGHHTWIVLKDAEGNAYSIGQISFGLGLTDTVSPLGKKHGGIICPDGHQFLPTTTFNVKKSTLEITQEQFDKLLRQVRKDKFENPENAYSLLKSNCTSYAKRLFKEIGIPIETRVHPIALIAMKCLPRCLGNPVWAFFRITHPGRSLLGRVLFFLSPLYVLNIMLGTIIKILSVWNFRGARPDITWKNLFFHPWNISIDHPYILRQWQLAQEHAPA